MTYKDKFYALIFALLLVGGSLWGYRIYQWRLSVNDRAYKAELILQYLSEPILTGPNGEKISRAQALDLLIQQAASPKQ